MLGRGPQPVLRLGRGANGGNWYDPADLDAWNSRRARQVDYDAPAGEVEVNGEAAGNAGDNT